MTICSTSSVSRSEPMHERRAQTGHQPRRRPSGRRHPRSPNRSAARSTGPGSAAASGAEAGRYRTVDRAAQRQDPAVTEGRLGKAVDKLRYETGDRTISIASITDQALDAYLAQRGC